MEISSEWPYLWLSPALRRLYTQLPSRHHYKAVQKVSHDLLSMMKEVWP